MLTFYCLYLRCVRITNDTYLLMTLTNVSKIEYIKKCEHELDEKRVAFFRFLSSCYFRFLACTLCNSYHNGLSQKGRAVYLWVPPALSHLWCSTEGIDSTGADTVWWGCVCVGCSLWPAAVLHCEAPNCTVHVCSNFQETHLRTTDKHSSII